MAFEIVDGMTGTKHISSDDLSALNIATVGKADCVLGYGDNFELTMQSANSATLGTGVGMVGGKRFWNQAATNLTVQSGTQGQKRNDLVVARYAKTSAGIESITPVVVKGKPSTGTAADPATTSNDLKLWRIPLDGISVGTPVRLFDPVASLATLGDSVSLYETKNWGVVRVGMTVYVRATMIIADPAEGITCPYVIPEELRPSHAWSVAMVTEYGGADNSYRLLVMPDGTIKVHSMSGKTDHLNHFASLSYPIGM
nr:MAG: protein of unknown function DUF4815 [Bacteriophage sp.]